MLKLIAHNISKFFSPALVFILGAALTSIEESPSLLSGTLKTVLLSAVSLLIPYTLLVRLKIKIDPVNPTNINEFQNNPTLLFSILLALSSSAILTLLLFKENRLTIIFLLVVGCLSVILYFLRFLFNCSGHTTAITSISFLASHQFGISFLFFLPVILLVAVSRVILNVHSVLDVLCGMLLGVLIPIILLNIGLCP